jgi:hypothetical protein
VSIHTRIQELYPIFWGKETAKARSAKYPEHVRRNAGGLRNGCGLRFSGAYPYFLVFHMFLYVI